MAPLSDHPIWLIPSYRIEGREAVRALYERVLNVMPAASTEEILRALDDPSVTHWGESHCLIEYSEEYPLHRGWVLVVHFDGDRVAGEHGYQTLPDELARLAGALAKTSKSCQVSLGCPETTLHTERLWLALSEEVLLADSLNGDPLTAAHGAPLRFVGPAVRVQERQTTSLSSSSRSSNRRWGPMNIREPVSPSKSGTPGTRRRACAVRRDPSRR
jgi:hypothetical protein